MKLPRDLSGQQLSKTLTALGYSPTRQRGSHLTLTTQRSGEHHLTIPMHDPLKVGTLNGILKDVAAHHKLSRDEVLRTLFQ